MGKNKEHEQMLALGDFIERSVLDEVLGVIKSGKEATVYLCQASAGRGLVAAKVYRSTEVRRFSNDAVYREGRGRAMKRRDALAIAQKSRAGRELAFASWVSDEYETLTLLRNAGCDVPRPLERSESVIIMEYISDDDGEPAPLLANVRLGEEEARVVWARLLRNIELMLANDRVHGDLSPFNVLYGAGGTPWPIDFPQAVDARFNSNALTLLERDIDRLAAYFERYGVRADAWRIAHGLWGRFLRSEL